MTSPESLYYSIVLISFVIALFRAGANKTGLFVVLVFWGGLFSYWGTGTHNLYKIFMVCYAILLWSPKIFSAESVKEKHVNIGFLFFTIVFWVSIYIHGGNWVTILSQYGFKYGAVFLIFHGLRDIQHNHQKRDYLKNILLQVLFIQVALSVVKILLFGFVFEAHVGSVAYNAGGPAVVLPIIALILYRLTKKQKLKTKDWLIMCSFLIISLASAKRAPVFLFPVFVFLLSASWRKLFHIRTFWLLMTAGVFIFYLGVRLTPSLTPENQIWGSFNLNHVVNYATVYNFGTDDITSVLREDQTTSGRGGSLLLLFNHQRLGFKDTKEVFFGRGLYRVAVAEEGRLLGGLAYGVEHQGLMGAIVMDFYTLGIFGVLSIMLFSITIIKACRNQQIRWLLMSFYLWEYLLYYNQVLFFNASALLVVFICFYANAFYPLKQHKTNKQLQTT